MEKSHFFALLSRMKYIGRWGLMRSASAENVAEHTLQVAMFAHGLAVIKNEKFGGRVDPAREMCIRDRRCATRENYFEFKGRERSKL